MPEVCFSKLNRDNIEQSEMPWYGFSSRNSRRCLGMVSQVVLVWDALVWFLKSKQSEMPWYGFSGRISLRCLGMVSRVGSVGDALVWFSCRKSFFSFLLLRVHQVI